MAEHLPSDCDCAEDFTCSYHKQEWIIVRKGREHLPPRVIYRGSEEGARRKWSKLDVRQGWAEMLRPSGARELFQSGPFGVRTRW